MPTATPFNNLITFSRGSNATVTGSNGLIQWAPNNLLTFSEQFDNAAWGKSLITITANSSEAPDGTITADRIVSAGGAFPQISQAATLLAGQAYTFSIWVRSDGTTQIQQTILLEGQLTNFTPTSTWQRISVTVPSSAGGSRSAVIATNNGSAPASSFLIWGAQLELGSTATTYNPTTVKNLLGFSEAFDNAAWSKSNSSIVTGAQANPINGLFTAQKLMENTANSVHRFIVGATVTAIPYTMSIYAKAAERNWIAVGNTSDGQLAHFNLTSGTVGTILGGATAAITNIGSGWYRCSVTFTPTAGSRTLAVWLASADNTLTYTGDGNSGVYIYGAQLSDSASLDPYVPTPGAAPSSTAFYGPRFDFDPVTRAPRGILIEEQRTNLFLRSEEFDVSATWIPVAASVTANATTSPSGAANADKLIEDATTGVHSIYQNYNQVLGTVYTMSFYAKAAERTWVRTRGAVGVNYFNLANGTLGTLAAGVTATITAVGNGWYRVTATYTSPSTSAANSQIAPTTADNVDSYAGTAGSGIFIYGAQLEAGAFATSYIPTVASTVTRSADVATITGQNFAQWYAGANGSVLAEFSPLIVPAAGSRVFSINDGTSTNRILSSPSLTSHLLVIAGGVGQADLDGGTPTANVTNKTAAAYALNDFAVSLNAGATVTDTSGTVPVVSSFNIGSENGSSQLNGHIRNIRFIPARAADFQLQGLST